MSMKMTTKKTFDCVAFKRRAQAEIYEDIKNMSFDQEITYFSKRAQTGKLGHWWKKIKKAGT